MARLSDKLKSSDEEERRDAVRGLAALETQAANALVAAMVNDPSERVRASAIAALGAAGDAAYVPAIASRLAQDKSIFVRKTAAYALGRLRAPSGTGPLVAALKDKSDEVRGATAVALGEYSDGAAILPLISALSDKNDFVRGRSARALGSNGPAAARAVPSLIQIIETDGEHYVRQEAVVALGMIGDRSALPALYRASRDPSPYLSSAALSAIRSIEKNKEAIPQRTV
ncbi:MAG TPA: HEAT repeat domain-containing protein [Blastocatellia bacterium]|nr:HEAT repeat domain-containing protein [Blastocatellia bacterium]